MNNVETIFAKPPSDGFEAFVYRWTVLELPPDIQEDRKYYTGLRAGDPNDGYYQSSTSKIFKKLFSDPRTKWKREILLYGTLNDMRTKENRLLEAVDAKDNPEYFNKTNGYSVTLEPDYDACELFFDSIESGAYPIEYEAKEDHFIMDYVQVRESNDDKHVQDIADRIEEQGGDTRSKGTANPVIVLLDRLGEGKHQRLNGTHTVLGANKSKSCTEIPVKNIPHKDHKHLTDQDTHTVGMWMNPIPKQKIKVNQPEDAVRYIKTLVAGGVDVNSNSTYSSLQRAGYSKRQINAAVKKVAQDIKNAKNNKLANVINWNTGEDEKVLDKRIEALKNKYEKKHKKRIVVVKMSSGSFNIGRVLEKCYNEFGVNLEWKCVIMLYHSNKDHQEAWENTGSDKWKKILKHTITNCECTIKEVPMHKTDVEFDDYSDYYSTGK